MRHSSFFVATLCRTSFEISLGPLSTRAHLVTGEVFALSDRVLEIRNFLYDGQGPDAYFWADTDASPTSGGNILQDGGPTNSCGATLLPEADGTQTYHVEFPEDDSLRNYIGSSIGVWCRIAAANFGEIVVPATLDGLLTAEEGPALQCSTPRSFEISLGSFNMQAHLLAGEVFALSDRVLEIRSFVYDGQGPDAFFWADSGAQPSAAGNPLWDGGPTNSCGATLLPEADGTQTYRVEFPEGDSLRNYLGGSIGVWCRLAGANFGEVAGTATLGGLLTAEAGPALQCTAPVPGISLGSLTNNAHGLGGEVFALSDHVLEVRNFAYDGQGPDAFKEL
jgi:hypothetical protein